MPLPDPASLRYRADRLRRVAHLIEEAPAMHLDRYAGVDTWQGPRPNECLQLLRSAQHRMHHAAEELRTHAWSFDRQADELELAARLALQVPG